MTSFEFAFSTRLIFGAGTVNRICEVTRELDCSRPLLVADPGIRDAGLVDTVLNLLTNAGLNVEIFDQFGVNPDSTMVDRGVAFATSLNRDSIIGLGGGSSLDCAKGINLILMNGGQISDYRGYGHAKKALLPMVAIPTTAGTGSEAQSYAVISDSTTHLKMACGDPQLAFSTAILDPELTLSQPAQVTASAGFDAIAHAVETAVTTRRTTLSMLFSKEAFRLLNANYERVLTAPNNLEARGAMHLGAFYAGVAIEQSMLGAAHACANPLPAQYQLTHGVALAILLPHVVRWNTKKNKSLYAELMDSKIPPEQAGTRLAERLVELSKAGGFPTNLKTVGIPMKDLADLAKSAGAQWTGTFNPRPFSESEALEIYQCVY